MNRLSKRYWCQIIIIIELGLKTLYYTLDYHYKKWGLEILKSFIYKVLSWVNIINPTAFSPPFPRPPSIQTSSIPIDPNPIQTTTARTTTESWLGLYQQSRRATTTPPIPTLPQLNRTQPLPHPPTLLSNRQFLDYNNYLTMGLIVDQCNINFKSWGGGG